MKKIYESPKVEVLRFETSQIMVVSGFKGALGDEENGGDGSAALSGSYRNSLWGDDE